ncbi:MAG: hypothetical protein ACU83O_14240, partial [Gammaproteobacteria bacterium]
MCNNSVIPGFWVPQSETERRNLSLINGIPWDKFHRLRLEQGRLIGQAADSTRRTTISNKPFAPILSLSSSA